MRANKLNWARMCAGVLFILAPAFLAGCSRTYTYRYRLTVVVRADGKEHVGSSVVEVEERRTASGGAGRPLMCGDATLVDLGQGRVLVALTTGSGGGVPGRDFLKQRWHDSPTYVLLEHFGYDTQWSWRNPAGLIALASQSGNVELSPDEMPGLVTFDNVQDPRTIEQVDPRNVSAVLGHDVTIVKATLEPTQDRITVGSIQRTFHWFDPSKDFLDGSMWGDLVLRYENYVFQRCRRRFGLFDVRVPQG
jgi:hypothetical protein